jgi:dethiobiotin synthetase
MTLVVVTGVGTDIGKTHVAASLTLAWSRFGPVRAYKPVESGVTGSEGPDEQRLRGYSSFHVKRPLLQVRLRDAVSPHLAARAEKLTVDLNAIAAEVAWLRAQVHTVVELPGGLFTPLSDEACNADLLALLRPDATMLVAPNRLGVLHDVRACAEACRARGLGLDGTVLVAQETPDASAATNRAELARTSGLAVLASLPRGRVEDLVASGALNPLVEHIRRRRRELAPPE